MWYKEATFMGSKKLQVWLPLLLAGMMVVGMLIGYELKSKTSGSGFLTLSKKSSIQEVMDLVKAKYVDDVKFDSINQVVIDDVLAHLDPHSIYIPLEDVTQVNEQLAGNFQGIGVEFQQFNDTVNVTNVIKDGPSEKAGVLVGDKIIKANDSIALTGKKIKPDDIRKQLRGEADSKVNLTILRGTSIKKITITRGNIPVPSIDAAYIIAPQTGYIRINKFGERTYEEFMQNLEKLQKDSLNSLIIDLRGNGGGLLSEATAIADEFLSDDKLIVYTQGNHVPRYEYRCKRDGIFEKGKLVVLVDETSASASEVLSGALQDWDRATIIGRRTYGKGLVQQQFQLSDGSAVRLTIARYYTPLGRSVQKPYSNRSKHDYDAELLHRLEDGEVVAADSTLPKGKSYKTPKGHTVFGGGGITPDVLMPYDTSKLPPAVMNMYVKNTLSSFVYHYYMSNRQQFLNTTNANIFNQQFNPSESDWQSLTNYAIKDSISLQKIDQKSKTDMLARFKMLLARQLFKTQGYYQVQNSNDATVKKALEVLK